MTPSKNSNLIIYLVMALIGGVTVYNTYSVYELSKRSISSAEPNAVTQSGQSFIRSSPDSANLNVSTSELQVLDLNNSGLSEASGVDLADMKQLEAKRLQQQALEQERNTKLSKLELATYSESYERDSAEVEAILSKIEKLKR